jgi:hypothetical protein
MPRSTAKLMKGGTTQRLAMPTPRNCPALFACALPRLGRMKPCCVMLHHRDHGLDYRELGSRKEKPSAMARKHLWARHGMCVRGRRGRHRVGCRYVRERAVKTTSQRDWWPDFVRKRAGCSLPRRWEEEVPPRTRCSMDSSAGGTLIELD